MLNNSEFEENIKFDGLTTDIKPIALYLPQFHTFPENDAWWGEGFTEWTNVKRGESRFPEHYQPREPHEDFGYYDLSKVETLIKQVKLAKSHGIYGFAIYYYWFSGKQLMKKPIDNLLNHKEINMPFFLIWANENWTRTWDGKERDVLIRQGYTDEDNRQFLVGLKKYIDDSRYIRIDGKPVIGIYAPEYIPNFRKTVSIWRKMAFNLGIGDIYILVCDGDKTAEDLEITDLVDGEYEFPPRGKGFVSKRAVPDKGTAFDYLELVETERHIISDKHDKIDFFCGAMLDWDNSARRKSGYHCWFNFSLQLFYDWIKEEIIYSRNNLPPDKRFIFINAWNEWGEGTYLEPDKKYGFASINTLSKAIYNLPYQHQLKEDPIMVGTGPHSWSCTYQNYWGALLKEPQVAVQAHIYYIDLIEEIVRYTNNIPVPYDLFITTDNSEKANRLKDYCGKYSDAEHVFIDICDNKGRDVIPFIKQMSGKADNYLYLCHIHTKKSEHQANLGNLWRTYLYENLLGSREIVAEILELFINEDRLGIVMPENLDLLSNQIGWGVDKSIAEELLRRLGIDYKLPEEIILFPAGDMFWMRMRAIRDIFDYEKYSDLIPEEKGQVDGTIMHAIERTWLFIAEARGFSYHVIRNMIDNRPLLIENTIGLDAGTDDISKNPLLKIAKEISIIDAWKITLISMEIFLEKKFGGKMVIDKIKSKNRAIASRIGLHNSLIIMWVKIFNRN